MTPSPILVNTTLYHTQNVNLFILLFDWLRNSIDIKLVLAMVALVTAYFQYKKAKEEANAFRQQLISILHHTEGIATELRTIGNFANASSFSTVNDVTKAVQAVSYNAETLFFGLIETKIGGIPLKNDLDKKYSEWADLELERKLGGLRQWLHNNNLPETQEEPFSSRSQQITQQNLFTYFKKLLFGKRKQ